MFQLLSTESARDRHVYRDAPLMHPYRLGTIPSAHGLCKPLISRHPANHLAPGVAEFGTRF